ncbi:MAG: FAD-dependent thymidylate synthase [Pirellulales bacterium]
MQVTCVGIKPTQALVSAGSPALTPELLAACGARYSRNGEGLQAILARVDSMNEDAAVDSIFKMVDYGHQSIADMVPVAMFIDKVSLWAALRMWWACPTAGGQESSTRYIQLDPTAAYRDPEFITDVQVGSWQACLQQSFAAYGRALELWTTIAERRPEVLRLPQSLIESSEPKDKRTVARISRNYAFDRARYYLPLSALTNVMLLMSARGWVSLIKQLYSERTVECRTLAEKLRAELERVAPRLIRHARFDDSYSSGARQEFDRASRSAASRDVSCVQTCAESGPFLDVMVPPGVGENEFVEAVQFHKGRYDFIGSDLQRTAVRFGWQAIPVAEIRDLNRHRTGSKFFNLAPVGTYFADDEIAKVADTYEDLQPLCDELTSLRGHGVAAAEAGYRQLAGGNPAFMYWLPMGIQCYYEHTTTANHFIYQAELRTGLGSHYVYAARMREVLELWHDRFPATAAYVQPGTAEPE